MKMISVTLISNSTEMMKKIGSDGVNEEGSDEDDGERR